MKNATIYGITPFEQPDVELAVKLKSSRAFPVLHLGRNLKQALIALEKISQRIVGNYGVCIADASLGKIKLPEQVDLIVAPIGVELANKKAVRVFYQVFSMEEARLAKAIGADGIIVKGNESAGKVAYESSYILFQRIIKEIDDIDVYVQGGIGTHTAAALVALGAKGVFLDSQLVLFPECSVPAEIKQLCEKLSGNETKIMGGERVLVRPNAPTLSIEDESQITAYYQGFDLTKNYLPMGQDITLSLDLVTRFGKLDRLVFGFHEAIFGHLNQAKSINVLHPHNSLAKDLNITYPIAQGPMTRVSDVAAFANVVSEEGALPFIALSLLKGQTAEKLIQETKTLAGDKTWGVGILGFAPQALRDEQLGYILEARPPVVLIAGGRPSQAKPLEKLGIKTFLHVPSVSLLDMFLKEGARRFVFEGRECGGHVGPLSSMVLWEKQIERLLQENNPEEISVFFAGGIHDAQSAAFVAVMAAPLAAKGVNIGILMGTAYLYTKEAVSTGAINANFQQQAIASADTVLLETAPGHETRCLNSAFATFFNQEKEDLQKQGIDKKEIWAKLETLNVGRLRIAAKGIERKGDELIKIEDAAQLSLGMYMIGQVAAMQDQVTTVAELHKNVGADNFDYIAKAALRTLPKEKDDALNVAIVGMACIFPGAKNIEEYWRNIILGKDSVTEVPDDRWNKDLYYNPESAEKDMSHSKWGGFIPRIDFDPLEYGIPPQSLSAIDPTQLLSLMVAKQALDDAGYRDGAYKADNVSVIIGAEGGNDLANSYSFRGYFKQVFGTLPEELDAALPDLTEDSFPGILANVISGRITNRLNLGGRNYTVDAACASSLAAIDLACQELFLEKSDMVLAGGADLHNGINDYLMFSSTHALSRKGRCATFDSEADGIALGEGIAMVVLKRQADALRDGDRIYAVIQGVGGSSDGKSLGLTAPRKSGQVKALERAYAQAGISPSLLGLVEAHGTGTVVGDKTELSALTDMMLQSGATFGQTHLGSVKTQIGHTKCAAGLAGLIKATLALYHGIKPPTINLNKPNGYYNAKTSPFAFQTEAGLWTQNKRYAGVSAFGFGGTNFHAVLQSDHQVSDQYPSLKSWPSELFVFRGDTYEESKERLAKVKGLLEANDSINIKDIAYSLAVESTKPIQLSIVADRDEDLIMKIDLVLSGVESKDTYITKKVEGKVAFMFPGQGSQRINMARDLFVIFPSMRKLLKDRADFQNILFPDKVFDEQSLKNQKEKIKDTTKAQPLLGIVDLALANYLRDLGIEPDMVAGHSYGELPALCFAGAFSEDELVYLSEERAKSILDAVEGEDTGSMLAVNANQKDLLELIATFEDVYPVNFNSPAQTVIAGTTPAILKLAEKLKAVKMSYRMLEVACAFHSPLVKKSKELYQDVLEKVTFNELSLPVWSNTTAEKYPASAKAIKERLTDHLVKPVQFVQEIEQMYADGARIFIEVGPGKVLTALTKACIGKDEVLLYVEDNGRNKLTHLLCSIAGYLATGRSVKLEKLFEGRDTVFLDLDAPEQYKKSGTVWFVDGQHAIPSNGKMPSNGALPIIKPIKMKEIESKSEYIHTQVNPAEAMMQEYLNGMKMMIQAQRDVMLQFLGHQVSPAFDPHLYQAPTNFQSTPVARTPLVTPEVVPAQKPKNVEVNAVKVDVKLVLLQIVSDKTGYPEEMLGMEMDLEADLSIDSIKRMEIIGALRTQLGNFNQSAQSEDAFVEQLAAIKTLAGLVNWIRENTAETAEAATVADLPVKDDQKNKVSIADVKDVLLGVVSEKTGYPKDMLGLDLDLEADLSIDSIKRIEIIGSLKTLIGFDQAEEGQEDLMEKLASIKTLNGLLSWVEEIIDDQSDISVSLNQNFNQEVKIESKENLSRLRFELISSELKHADATELNGFKFAITDDFGVQAKEIKQLFEAHGAVAKIVSSTESLKDYDGLIMLNLFVSSSKTGIMEYISRIKELDFQQMKWVYFISDTLSHLKDEDDASMLRHFQGYSGLFKSLDKEYTDTKFRLVSLTAPLLEKEVAEIALKEILNTDQPSEVIYDGKKRQILEPVPAQLSTGEASHLQIDKNAVVLVFGGAQGITAKLMSHFAKDYPCHYILVGRSVDPRSSKLEDYSDLKSAEEIRARLISTGYSNKPAEIEQQTSKIFKNNEILQAIRLLEETGSVVTYASLDLRNEEGLTHFIQDIYVKHGRIDGVVHGAGLLEDKLFHGKTLESFKRVFDTKVTPLRVLAEQLRPETQFVVFFSSIASVYGNRGQTDYAAANSVMDRYAGALKKKISGKVMAINWGPWKGAGMVSANLEKEYERRGISLIPLDHGLETFMNEMKYGKENQVLIMAGDNW